MYLIFVLSAVVAMTRGIVIMQKGSTWIQNGLLKTQAFCTFTISTKQGIGEWKMSLTTNLPTNSIEIWVMDVIEHINNDKTYNMQSKYEYWPQTIDVQFILTYVDGNVPISGSCSSNVEPGVQPTTPPVTTTPPTTTPPTTTPPTTTQASIKSSSTKGATSTTQSATSQKTSSYPTTTTSQTPVSTKYDYGEVIRLSILFYEAQRSGKLPANNRIPYRGDSALNDKGVNGEDLTGGWYDAGDGVKFNLPMSSSTTLLSWGLIQWKDAYAAVGQLDLMYDSIKWPLDYFLKCWNQNQNVYYCQVGDGNLDHAFWGRPEEMTMSRPPFAVSPSAPGSDVAGETAAALAAGSIAFSTKNAAYSADLLSKARTLYTFAKQYRGKYSDSVSAVNPFYTSYSGYQDELCFSAAMLYKATKESQYLTDALSFATTGTAWSLSWDEKTVACQLLLFEATGQNQYKTAVENFINDYMGNGVPQTNCGLAYRLQWGSNRYAANAAFIALMAADTPGFNNAQLYKTWAMSQIHYMLGENKYGISYQIGYGSYFPRKPHHRASSCPNLPASCTSDQLNAPGDNPQILYGALVGGPDQQDSYADVRTDYVKNEVACDYNAGFQSAAAGLLHFALQKTLPAAPTPKCP